MTARTIIAAAATLLLANGQALIARQSADRTVDAVTLALAVRSGQAKQYEGYTVTGEGRSFDTNCTPGDPVKKTETVIPLTLAVLGKDGKPQPVITLEESVNLQMVGRQMLMVKLRGADLKIKTEPDPAHPVLYTFTAKFAGEVESFKPPASILDNNPKPFDVAILRDTVAK